MRVSIFRSQSSDARIKARRDWPEVIPLGTEKEGRQTERERESERQTDREKERERERERE